MVHPFIVSGLLRCSLEQDFFVETDAGEQWLLDLPWSMSDQAFRLHHHRVTVEGGRTGERTIVVNRIEEQGGRREANS